MRGRPALAALTALSLVASACAGIGSTTTSTRAVGGQYAPDVVVAYMEGCTEDADEEFCACTIEEFQDRLALREFLALDDQDLERDPTVQEVLRVCLRGDGATSTTEPDGARPATLDEVIEITTADLEAYWTLTMPEVWGMGYQPPAFARPYFVSRGDVPGCGGPLARDVYEFNAFYCELDDTIQWDAEGLMASLFEEFGDFTVSLVLAHEWGHAIQARYGFDDLTQPTIVSELQADCFAGAWAGWVAEGHSGLLTLETGDLEEAMAGFLLIGDELGTAPSGPDSHGGTFDRLSAFFDGFNGGAALCASYEEEPPLVVFIPLAPDDDPQRGGDLPYEVAAAFLIDALEAFWEIVYPEVFGEPWEPVSAVVPYYPSTGTVPTCGGFDLADDFYEYNAFYCPADDFVAWDDEVLFPTLYVEIGDFALGLLLALQWGQAVQHRAGLVVDGPGAGLQVDCFAGTWTAALTFDENPMGLYLSAGDLEEGIAAFLTFSDAEATGVSAFERFEAFRGGFFEGVEACGT